MADLAYDAEQAGWDGFFLWDHILIERSGNYEMVDPWIALAAVAMKTEKIRIGTMVTPLPRRRPWKLARETISLDHLSNGRLILGVGLGAPLKTEYATFGENPDPKILAKKLNEGLDILTGLWSGNLFGYKGEYYQLKKVKFLPKPVQSPRIPIWVGGGWPAKAPFRRAAKWDGVVPIHVAWPKQLTPKDVKDMMRYIESHRTSSDPFEVCVGTNTSDDPEKAAELITSFAEAGATWWMEGIYGLRGSFEEMRSLIQKGPPKIT